MNEEERKTQKARFKIKHRCGGVERIIHSCKVKIHPQSVCILVTVNRVVMFVNLAKIQLWCAISAVYLEKEIF